MAYVVQPVAGKAFDTDISLSSSEARAVVAAGYAAVCRYGPLPNNAVGWDLTTTEIESSTAAGLTVWLVQHPRKPQINFLYDSTGQADAECILAYAKSIGYVAPEGSADKLTIALDMEGVQNPGPLTSFAHAKRWVTTVLAAGYRALIYLGYLCGLTAAECDALVALGAEDDVAFWLDAADPNLRPKPARGIAVKQHMQMTLCGFGADPDDILQPVVYGLALAPPEDVEPHNDPPDEPHIV